MATITLRNVKGSALTFQEGDDNFSNLNNDKLEADGGTFTNGTLTGYDEGSLYTATYSATWAPDVGDGNVQTMTLTGNVTVNGFTNAAAGQSITIIFEQDGTGNRTFSTATIKFAGGTADLSAAPNSVDIMTIYYDGSDYYGSLATDFSIPT